MTRALIIDDSLTVRMDLDEAFQAAGWQTTLCPSATAARQAIVRDRFDCIILDVLLPDTNGMELLSEFKSRPETAAIPIILLASQEEVADQIQSLSVGADEYVAKPYDRTHLIAQAQRLAARRPKAADRARPVILAVDDSLTYLYELSEQLQQDDLEIIQAQSGPKALELLRSRRVDCVLLDMLMPDLSGQELCRQIKDSPAFASIPVIMLTGREDREAILDSFNAGADDYVPKSGDFTVLRVRLRAQLRRRQVEEDARRIREELHANEIEVAQAKAVQRQNAVLQGVNRVLEQSLQSRSEQDLGEVCLGVAETITESQVSFIGEIGPDGYLHDLAISNPGWDACKMYDSQGHRRPPGDFPIHGIYGRVLVDGKSLLVNDPASHPDRIGVPPGHPPLTAFLGVPLVQEGKTIGMIGVGNRPGGYRPQDQETLEVLAPAIVEAMARKRAEGALRQMTEELARSNADLEQFAYVASHDLQEPLRMVSSFLQLLHTRYETQLDENARSYIDFSVDGAKRMTHLIQDLLAYSRVERKGNKLRPTDAGAALDGALANLRGSIQESCATIIRDDLPTVVADPTQLMQLFQNLIGNAIKFRVEGRPCQVHVGAKKDAGQWLFSVRDNGIGIPPEQSERVFVIFQRLHGRKEYPGTGIGLAICKKIVERHGGKIWVESTPGSGAAFHFTISDRQAR